MSDNSEPEPLIVVRDVDGLKWEVIRKLDLIGPEATEEKYFTIISFGAKAQDPKRSYLMWDSVMRKAIDTFFYGINDGEMYFDGGTYLGGDFNRDPHLEAVSDGIRVLSPWSNAKPLPSQDYFVCRPVGFDLSSLSVKCLNRYGRLEWTEEDEDTSTPTTESFDRPMKARELLELVMEPDLILSILLNETVNSEPQVAPSDPDDDLDIGYLRRRMKTVLGIRRQNLSRRAA